MSRIRNTSNNPLPFKSSVAGFQFPAVPNAYAQRYTALMYQWERSQWLSASDHRALSFQQLSHLLHAAHLHTPYYKKKLTEAGYDPTRDLDDAAWGDIPLLSRGDIQTHQSQLGATRYPKAQHPAKKVNSSGSTGRPIEVLTPATKGLIWSAATLFEHILHGRDFGKKAAAIRVVKDSQITPEGARSEDWGPPFNKIFKTGSAAVFDIHQDPEQQADWLIRENPSFLLLFPSSLEALLPILQAKEAELPNLEHFRCVSEQLPDHLRAVVQEQFGRHIVDMYSAQEVGYIALQCPEHDHYHLFQDICFTEILRDDGSPCDPGEVGRVVVTDPHNYVFPLIRYDIGDYAEMGEPCPCGRGLPVINKIMGRVRNLITLPDGSRHWPMTSSRRFREIANINQFQLVQTSLHKIQAKFVCDHPLTTEHRTILTSVIQDRLTYPFDVEICEVSDIPRGANGKFEEFKSEVTPQMAAEAKAALV